MTARCAIRRSRACARTRRRPTSCASRRRRSRRAIATPSRAPRKRDAHGHARRLPREDRATRRQALGRHRRRHQAVASRQAALPRGEARQARPRALLRRDRRLDPAASSRPPAGAGALSRRLEQAMLFPEARRQERQRRGHARRSAGGQGHGHLFRRQFAAGAGRAGAMGRGRAASVGLEDAEARSARSSDLRFRSGRRRRAGSKSSKPSACCARCSTISGSRAFSRRPAARACTSSCRSVRRSTGTQAKGFTKAVADLLVGTFPDRFIATLSKAQRKGKIFIDYLRNAEGATAIAPYAIRARAKAPVSTPIAWKELDTDVRFDHFNVRNVPERAARPAQGSVGVDRRDPSNGDTRDVQARPLRGLVRWTT